jgi:hypothetical protein
VEVLGGRVIMTSPTHERASDRVAEAADQVEADIVVMIQGDEPMITSAMIAAAVTPLLANRSVECVNLVRRITKQHDYFDPNIIKVVIKLNSNPGLEDWIAAQREPRLVLGSGASVFQDVKSVDVVLAGNSSVLSDAVTAGRPSGYVVDLDHGPHDLHRFVECGLIYSMEDESGSFRWNPDLMLRFYQRPGWLNVLRYLRILMRMRILSAC